MIERVGAFAATISMGFTWTKTDVSLPSSTRATVERSRQQFAPASEVWKTTIDDAATIARVFSRAIDRGEGSPTPATLSEPRLAHEPFLAFRGNHVGV